MRSNSPEAAGSPGGAAGGAASLQRVRIWDLPLRLFHWLLVLCLIGSFVSVKAGEGNWMEWHYRFGYVALTLILFRAMWGIVGPRYSRFSSFMFSPRASLAYLRNAADAPRTLGHTPVGALSVFALLAAIGIQASVGLFTSDGISVEGPLARLVSNATVASASWVHYRNPWIILLLVGAHLAAILFYRLVLHKSLVMPMVTGDKLVARDGEPSHEALAALDDAATGRRAAIVLILAAVIVTCIVNWPLL